MRFLYRAYCRAAAQASCNPAVMAGGIFLLVMAYLVSTWVYTHQHALLVAMREAAAVVLCGVAFALIGQALRMVMTARGTHYSYQLRVIPVPEPVTVADTTSEPVPVRVPSRGGEPAFSYTLKPAEAAAMAADADALAGGDMDVVVHKGDIYELAGAGDETP
jgi:hypothetical protein